VPVSSHILLPVCPFLCCLCHRRLGGRVADLFFLPSYHLLLHTEVPSCSFKTWGGVGESYCGRDVPIILCTLLERLGDCVEGGRACAPFCCYRGPLSGFLLVLKAVHGGLSAEDSLQVRHL